MIRNFHTTAIGRRLRAVAAISGLALLAGTGQAQAACLGDCNVDNEVTVDEIVTMVNLALTGGIAGCTAADGNGDGQVTVEEIITAVNNALTGCPPMDGACGNGATDSGEDCDDGGYCAGGSDAGKACTAEADCAGDVGICVGGNNNLRGCNSADDCPSGECTKCRPVGGDGCAQNCTSETDLAYPFEPGKAVSGGVAIESGTGSTVYAPIFNVPLEIKSGSQVLTVGKSRDGGPVPVVIKASNVSLPAIPVQSVACACVRGATASTCGGTVYDENGVQSVNCTSGFQNMNTCPTERPCAAVHGPGNTASGFLDCRGEAAVETNVEVTQDCGAVPGEPPFPPVATITSGASGANGSAYLVFSAAIGTVVGPCAGTAAAYGPDGQFCTSDDQPSTFGSPNAIPLTTAMATGRVDNPADFEGDVVGPQSTTGTRFMCNGSNVTTASLADLAGVFTSCDQPTINDFVVINNFESKAQ